MHVLIVSQQWEPEEGIPQRRMHWLVEGLARAGHSICVVTSPPHYPEGKLSYDAPEHQPGSLSVGSLGETIYRTQFREYENTIPSRYIDQSVALASSLDVIGKAIREKKPDLILATAPPLPSILTAWYASRRFHIPYVVDLRDAWPDLARYVAYVDPRIPYPTRLRRTGARAMWGLAAVLAMAMRECDGLIPRLFPMLKSSTGGGVYARAL